MRTQDYVQLRDIQMEEMDDLEKLELEVRNTLIT